MKKIFMICPSSSQPRINKRAEQLNKISSLTVFGFRRKVYEQNCFSDSINYTSLGYLNDGQYFKRPIKLIKAILKIRKEKRINTLFYAMSIDCLLIAKLAGLKKGFYEVGDLRSADRKKSILSKLEKFLLANIQGVIITSKYFYTDYYKSLKFSSDKFLVIENKLSSYQFPFERPRPDLVKHPKIRIGLIGLFRYEKPIRFLIDFLKKNESTYQLDCYGDGYLTDLLVSCGVSSIRYHGGFKYPDDIKKIYQNIDLNFIVYDNQSKNVRLALPNKLYESIYFGIPILCASNTALSVEVNKLNVGRNISIENQDVFEQNILSVNRNEIIKLSKSALEIRYEELIDSSSKDLKRLINDI